MSAARRKDPGEQEAPFEERLARLEALVAELENGELGLEDGVERYREGVELLAGLQKSLTGAEHRVEELTAVLRQGLADLEGGPEPEDGAAS
ncbi:MAG TPA: exodeoxyribonuclease VII small subunit [Planctomycetota bacterium]